jgi:hypothetical protein
MIARDERCLPRTTSAACAEFEVRAALPRVNASFGIATLINPLNMIPQHRTSR